MPNLLRQLGTAADHELDAAKLATQGREDQRISDLPLGLEHGRYPIASVPVALGVASGCEGPPRDTTCQTSLWVCRHDTGTDLLEDARHTTHDAWLHLAQATGQPRDPGLNGLRDPDLDANGDETLPEGMGQRQPQHVDVPTTEHVEVLPRLAHVRPRPVSQLDSLGRARRARGIDEGTQVVGFDGIDHAPHEIRLDGQASTSIRNDLGHGGEPVISDAGLLGIVGKADDVPNHRVDLGPALDLGNLGGGIDEKNG